MIKFFLFDIEGTTTDINFVHKVLFPYAAENLRTFLPSHRDDPLVKASIANAIETVAKEEGKDIGFEEAIEKFLLWIREDRKHPALKELQGLIWDKGYVNNHFQGHVYADVLPFFRKILLTGRKIGIYSSGSVHAQKLIFGYSAAGDLTPLISYYFDTKIGPKREKASYSRIAKELGLSASEIHFFSDIPQELDAAEEAGLMITHVVREGTEKSHYRWISSFHEMVDKI